MVVQDEAQCLKVLCTGLCLTNSSITPPMPSRSVVTVPILPAALHVSVKPQALETGKASGCCGAGKDSKSGQTGLCSKVVLTHSACQKG